MKDGTKVVPSSTPTQNTETANNNDVLDEMIDDGSSHDSDHENHRDDEDGSDSESTTSEASSDAVKSI